jgi:hypothetical protein
MRKDGSLRVRSDYEKCLEATQERLRTIDCFLIPGNPAVIGCASLRPVALRLRLLTDLPFSVAFKMP